MALMETVNAPALRSAESTSVTVSSESTIVGVAFSAYAVVLPLVPVTGASLTAVIVIDAVAIDVEKAVVPPFEAVVA